MDELVERIVSFLVGCMVYFSAAFFLGAALWLALR